MGSMQCTNTMDKLGKIFYSDKKLLYNYCSLVEDDFNHVNIPLNEKAIIAMRKQQYKAYIKKHGRVAAFNYLRKIQEPHTKVNQIQYTNIKIQPNMTSQEMENHEVELLTALISHTVRAIK